MESCKNCTYSEDYGESFLFIRCERTETNMIVRKDFFCKHYANKEECIMQNINDIYSCASKCVK
ncbi:MAG: hypothetical protein AAGU14_02800 [Eubacteriaceae bacterium]